MAINRCGVIGLTAVLALVGAGRVSLGVHPASDPSRDVSELSLAIGDAAELLVVDPSGRRTGFDPDIREVVEQIPNSSYFRDALQNDTTGDPPTEISHMSGVSQPVRGTYRIIVTGLKLGTYTLSVRAFSQDGSDQPEILAKGIAGPGSSSSFSLGFTASPGGVSRMARVATFDSTLQDISNSQKLNLIAPVGVANSLTHKIDAVSAAKSRGDLTAAKNILNAFKNELRAQAGRHIDALAAQILREDADSLLRQFP